MQLIKERFAQLPQAVKDAITASDLQVKMRTIGDKYNLMLDKQGDLQRSILLVMLGLIPSNQFVSSISNEMGVDNGKAALIAQDVSDQIFNPIRTHLREWDEKAELDAKTEEEAAVNTPIRSDLERLGDFTIDNTETAGNSVNPATGANNDADAFVEKRPDILEGIENPGPANREYVTNNTEVRTDPLVDHLLTTPVTIPPQKIEQPTTAIPKSPIKTVVPDPYKEAVN